MVDSVAQGRIRQGAYVMADPCEVLISVKAKKATGELPEGFVSEMRTLLPIFAKQPGFLGGEFFVRDDGKGVFNRLRWKTVADHKRCQRSADFGEVSEVWGRMFALCNVEVTTNTLAETIPAGVADPLSVAARYHQAWTSGDEAAFKDTLGDGFSLESPFGLPWPKGATVELLHASADGDEVVQIYRATNAAGYAATFSELITVSGDRIAKTSKAPFVDEAAFREFASG